MRRKIVSKRFGDLLKEYRRLRGLTQKQLLQLLWDSGKVDVKRNGLTKLKYNECDVSKWEHNVQKPPSNIVAALEHLLGTPNGLLLGAAGYYAEAKLASEGEENDLELSDVFVPWEELRKRGYNGCITKLPNTKKYVLVKGQTISIILPEKTECEFVVSEYVPLS
jgi:transcriptional regulator with XRE-family HTH domain